MRPGIQVPTRRTRRVLTSEGDNDASSTDRIARQLKQSFFDARVQRVWAVDGHVAKRSFKQTPMPAENQNRAST